MTMGRFKHLKKVRAVETRRYDANYFIISAGCSLHSYFSTKPKYDNNSKSNVYVLMKQLLCMYYTPGSMNNS